MIKFLEYIKKYDILIFIILGFLFYFPALFYVFLDYDDIKCIIQNEYLNGSFSIKFLDFFIPNHIDSSIYTPLTFIVYWLIIKLFGINSLSFHFVNVFFYILSTIALFYLLKKIINNYSVIFFAVILYILHPCHIENTAWISAMGYNISALFFFLSFLYFIIAFDENKKLNYVYSVIFYIFAILSQPIAVTLPAILFLWIFCFRRNKFKESIIFIASYIPFLFVYLFLYSKNIINSNRFIVISHSYIEKISILGQNIFNSFFPINLCPFKSLPNFFSIIYIFIFLILIYLFRKNVIYLFFIFWGIISILPYSNIFFDIAIPLADRYLLLSSVSSCVFISYFSFYILEKFKEQNLLKYISFIFFSILYLISFIFYLPAWKDDRSLWTYAYNTNPKDINSIVTYSTFLINNKEYDLSLIIVNKLIEDYPSLYQGYDLKVRIYIEQGLYDEALKFCENLKEHNSEYYKAYLFLSNIYTLIGNYDEADKYLNIAEEKCKKYGVFNGENLELFLNKKILLSFITSDFDKFIENFKILSNNFKLMQDNGEFLEILNKYDYKSREEICLNYLKNHNTQYSGYVINLLSCLYMKENYKEDSSKIMKYLFKEMKKAQKDINDGDIISAEKTYLYIISKNKYMYESYRNLGILYLQTNRLIESKKIFNKMLEINPNDTQIRQLLVNIKNE